MQTQKQDGFIKVVLLLAIVCAVVVFAALRTGHARMVVNANNLSATTGQSAPSKPVAPNECTNNISGQLLLVSISKQQMWACNGESLVKQSAVTTGATEAPNAVDDATPTGTWHVYEKFRNLDLKGSDANGPWDDYVQYWMPFDTAVGFHDASWQTFPFGSSEYQTGGSHGCVQLPTPFAAWLYAWAPVGTTVTVEA